MGVAASVCLRDGWFFFFANDIKLMVLVADIVMHFFRALLPSQMSHTTTSSYITPICVEYSIMAVYFGVWLCGQGGLHCMFLVTKIRWCGVVYCDFKLFGSQVFLHSAAFFSRKGFCSREALLMMFQCLHTVWQYLMAVRSM